MNFDLLQQAANQARGLAIDAIHECSSGHLGLPLGCAEIGAILYGGILNVNPSEPRWLNRDRFVLSAGHGSMFLYSWLHLAGFDLSLQDIRDFRKKGSKTPGHPEFRHTPGVECTTGPLGQGIANSVGFALSAKRAAARFNTAEHTIFNQTIYCLAGDGCLQEGIAKEAMSLAPVLQLDNLILIYDSNDITLDARAEKTQTLNDVELYSAMGWEVVKVDGHDMPLVLETLTSFKKSRNGKPKLLIAKTIIAKGVPEVECKTQGHGEGGGKYWESAHERWGIPANERFYVSLKVRHYMNNLKKEREAKADIWKQTFEAWKQQNPALSVELESGMDACSKGIGSEIIGKTITPFDEIFEDATRSAGAKALNDIAANNPFVITTSADLYSSNKNYIKDGGDYSPENPEGRNYWIGIREHAMGAICNGIAYDGLFRVSGATFLVFVDYMRASIRMAALSKLPVTYILTHDSVAVGEDGPTHQPVETYSSLRIMPNLDVIRPADPEETAGAYMAAMERADGPTALILTRQKVTTLNQIPLETRRQGALKGGYIARQEQDNLQAIIISCGSELGIALEAAERLGPGIRVVSMPSFYRFDRQSKEYRDSVLPAICTKRVSIEAGITALWAKYVGTEGVSIGIDTFGFSAPGNQVLSELGMNVDHLVETVQKIIS